MTHPSRQDGQSLRDELMAKVQLQRKVILDLCERVERLEMRADGLTPIERVQRRWAKKSTGGDKLDRLIAQDKEADGPAVPEDREPAALVGQPTDDELASLWVDAAHIDQVHGGIKFAREVLARWGHQPAPPAEGEVGDEARRLAKELRDQADDMSPALELFGLMHRAADLLEQRHAEPVPVSERLPVDVEQALIKAECALSDIAEGEPEGNDGDSDALLQWAEQRAATALSRIRPVMRLHGIHTSEWPPLPANALPLPAGEDPPPPQPDLPSLAQPRRDPWADPRLGVPFTEGSTQRGNGHGGPTTPKPAIVPKPQFPSPRVIPGNTP